MTETTLMTLAKDRPHIRLRCYVVPLGHFGREIVTWRAQIGEHPYRNTWFPSAERAVRECLEDRALLAEIDRKLSVPA